jgi:endonuclease III
MQKRSLLKFMNTLKAVHTLTISRSTWWEWPKACGTFNGGEVPHDVDDLQKLPGVGRKTANVIASVIFINLHWQSILMYSGFLQG